MAKKVEENTTDEQSPFLSSIANPRILYVYVGIAVVLLTLPILIYFLGKNQYQRSKATGCNDNNCQNVQNNQYWQITNCGNASDPDGDQQLCSWKGRVGICKGTNYCCPESGAQWTTNMSACATPTSVVNSPLPTNTRAPSSTPTPSRTPTMRPSRTPTPTPTNRPSRTPTPTSSPRPTNTAVPTPTITRTPTPTKAACNDTCYYSSDCISGLNCYLVGSVYTCRKAACITNDTCVCTTPTPTSKTIAMISETPTVEVPTSTPISGLFITPVATLTPTPNPMAVEPALSIDPFADKRNETAATFTVTGTSDPYADIDISIGPKGPTYTTTADATGKWRYIVTKSLASGKKELMVTARNSSGGQKEVKQSFTVKGASPFRPILIVIILVIVSVIGYLVYRQQMANDMPLPPPPSDPKPEDIPPETPSVS